MAKIDWLRLDNAATDIEHTIMSLQDLTLQVQAAGLRDAERQLDMATGDAMLALERVQTLRDTYCKPA